MQQFYANGLAMPRKMNVRQIAGNPSKQSWNLFDTGSGDVREVFECCSGSTRRTAEAHPKDYRCCPEQAPKRTRSAPEESPNSTRRNRWIFNWFLKTVKAQREQQASDLTTTLEQPKNDLRITQQRPKVDPSLTQRRPSLRTGYRQGSPKDDTTNTQETANNNTRNVRLMYRECTVSVRGVYRKGTREVLKRYWRATKDSLNACTFGVDQRYSKSRRVVHRKASHSRSRIKCLQPIAYGLQLIICFMLFNLSTAWAQSAEPRTAEGQSEIKPLQIGDTTILEHYALPYPDSTVVETTRKISGTDLDRFPMEKYHIEESILHKLRIGDPLPADLLQLPLAVILRDGNLDTLRLEEFGDKLIVLDFWASWCAPCVRSIEKWETYIDSLEGDYAFLGVHTDHAYKALPFLEQREWNSMSVIGLNAFVLARSFFDRIVAGKLVWIKNRRILALTGVSGYDRQMVQDLIDGENVQLPVDLTWTY